MESFQDAKDAQRQPIFEKTLDICRIVSQEKYKGYKVKKQGSFHFKSPLHYRPDKKQKQRPNKQWNGSTDAVHVQYLLNSQAIFYEL